MALKIEILAKAEEKPKMEAIASAIQQGAKNVNVSVQIIFTNDFGSFAGHSFNPAQTPIVFIAGKLEFYGGVPPLLAIQKKLVELRDKASQGF